MSVRQRVTRALDSSDLPPDAPLTEVHAIGPYVTRRLTSAFRLPDPPTVDDLLRATRRLTTVRLTQTLVRALQNDRANQCVSSRVRRTRGRSYHTADVNQHAYEAVATLLNYARTPDTRHDALPWRHPPRGPAAATCGCLGARACAASPRCVRSDDGRACVPVAPNARGFVGVPAHTDQHERVRDAARVRRAARITNGDPEDLRRGHARTLSYARRGAQLWRVPGRRVRSRML
jgi:hypothetical protein